MAAEVRLLIIEVYTRFRPNSGLERLTKIGARSAQAQSEFELDLV